MTLREDLLRFLSFPSRFQVCGVKIACLVPAEAKFFFFFLTCLDLKDIFFYICSDPQSQSTFAFKWENPNTGEKGQLTWTRLAQGFKNSPTIFVTALATDLKAFSADQHGCILLQYVNDLLLARPTWEDCMKGTHLLSLLWEEGYKVSWKKAQTCQNTVKYFTFHLSQGQHSLGPRGNRLSVPFQPPRLTGKSESFWELQVSAESGSLTAPSCPNPSIKPQVGKNGNP
jgi:hypothetical protein